MKNVFLALGLLIFCSCDGPSSEQKKSQVIDPSNLTETSQNQKDLIMKDLLVAFWNVENLFDTKDDPKTNDKDFLPGGRYEWTESKYQQKLDRLSTVINDFGDELPHLMGLVEVENAEVVADLVNHDDLKKGNYKIVHKHSKDQRGIDVALIFNDAYLRLNDHEFLDIDAHSEKPLYSRDILYAQFSMADGSVLHYFVNHWPSRRNGQKETEHKRLAAAHTLRSKLDKIRSSNPDAQILICGDFNDYPNDKSLYDVIEAKSIKDKNAMLVNLGYELDKKDKGTISYKGDWGMFDDFIVSRSLIDKTDLDVQKRKMNIFKEDYVLYFNNTYKEKQPSKFQGSKFYGGYSDHLAIHLKLNFK